MAGDGGGFNIKGPGLLSAEPGALAPGSAEELLSGRHILLVVTGGIAAYKAAYLARLLAKAGASLKTVMTEAGARFITPLSLEALTKGEVAVSMWERSQVEIEHISWAAWADLIVVAPATADFLAQVAQGRADSLASATILASASPVLLCPAMNSGMWLNAATRENMAVLRKRGLNILSPPSGELACGGEGPGRLSEPRDIELEIIKMLTPQAFAGKTVAVTAGATREPWDAIRYLSNRSSGKMGLALGLVSYLAGARVKIIAGPGVIPLPHELPGLSHIAAESTRDMLEALGASIGETDYLFMAAAPADFRPRERVSGKIKKDSEELSIPLALNPDILKTLSPRKKEGSVWAGFAAESEKLEERAWAKLRSKSLDLVVANQASGPSSAFGGDATRISILAEGREPLESGELSKFAAAWLVAGTAFELAGGKGPGPEKS